MSEKTGALSPEALEFVPGLLSIQESPPRRLPRAVLYTVIALFLIVLAWMILGRLDIIATAHGQLIPQTYVKIVQPADAGIVEQILVHEDQHVSAGQVLMRMDAHDADADTATLKTELALRSLQLRRIDAELAGRDSVKRLATDPDRLYRQIEHQLRAHRQAYTEALAQARDALYKAQHDYAAARQVLVKLEEVTPILKRQAESYESMGKAGYAPAVAVRAKELDYLEKAQDLQAQRDTVRGLAAAVAQARGHLAAVRSDYRSHLRNEWVHAERDYRKLQQAWAKQMHKNALLELRAPQAGIVEDIATHTAGTVVAPGTVLLSLVPDREPLVAVVRIKNDAIGFVHPHQKVRVKVAAYSFEKYGTLDGEVSKIGPNASAGQSTPSASRRRSSSAPPEAPPLTYKAVVVLNSQRLPAQGRNLKLVPGMEVTAEIDEGKRSVLHYLLSPVEKTVQDSGRER